MDERHRSLLRDAEHAHDATLWLRAASALARAREYDEAGRALLWARALGAETGPMDDVVAPATLDFERRSVGSMMAGRPFALLAWGPRSDRVYSVTEGRSMIVSLGVEPGANRRMRDVRGEIRAIAGTLHDERLVILHRESADLPQVSVIDPETKDLARLGNAQIWPTTLVAFHESDVHAADGHDVMQCKPEGWVRLALRERVLTWSGELVDVPPTTEGAPRTLRLIFSEVMKRDFPTRRSVERYCELATIGAVGLDAQEIRAAVKCVAASPAGSHVAFARDGSTLLVDLARGERRAVELDGEPLDARWSPSGRRLAVLTEDRVHLLTFTS